VEEKKDGSEPERASNEWVTVRSDHLVYQKLHLCRYLAELPELGTGDACEEQPA
jgi:hypothetical protein